MLACRAAEDGQHLSVCGQVISAAPLEEIAVFDRSGLAASLRYGRAGGAQGILRFELNVLREATQAETEWAFELEARQASGHAERVSYVVVLDGNSAAVKAGPVAVELAGGDSTPMVLHPEYATLASDNVLRIRGWILAQSPVTELKLNGTPVNAELELPRSDVAKSRPLYANAGRSGFDLALPLIDDMGDGALLLSAASASGAEQAIRLTPRKLQPVKPELPGVPPDPRRHIKLYCDEAILSSDGRLSVSGWAISAIGIREVTLALGEHVLGRAEFGLLRDDVADEVRHHPHGPTLGIQGGVCSTPKRPARCGAARRCT